MFTTVTVDKRYRPQVYLDYGKLCLHNEVITHLMDSFAIYNDYEHLQPQIPFLCLGGEAMHYKWGYPIDDYYRAKCIEEEDKESVCKLLRMLVPNAFKLFNNGHMFCMILLPTETGTLREFEVRLEQLPLAFFDNTVTTSRKCYRLHLHRSFLEAQNKSYEKFVNNRYSSKSPDSYLLGAVAEEPLSSQWGTAWTQYPGYRTILMGVSEIEETCKVLKALNPSIFDSKGYSDVDSDAPVRVTILKDES